MATCTVCRRFYVLGRILSASIGRPVRDKWPGCLRISVSATIHTWHEKGCIDSNGSSVSAAYVRRENAYGICNRFCIADSAFLSTFAKHGSVSSSSGGSGGDDGSSSDSESSDESISGSDESSSDSESCDEIVSDDDYSSGETSSSDSDVTSDEVFSDVLSSDDETGSTAANEHHTSSLGSQHVQPKTVKLSDFRRTEDGGIIIHSDVQFDEEEALSNAKDTDKVKSYDLQTLLHNIQRSQARKESAVVREDRTTMMSVEELVDFLREQNARDIVVIELPRELDYVRYFVTCCGAGSRHLGRMADNLVSELRKVRIGVNHRKVRVEGRDCEDWMAVDLGQMVVHLMLPATRERFELEKLWALGENLDDQCRALRLQVESPS